MNDQNIELDVPEAFTIDSLRNEIAVLNDEKNTLKIRLSFANQVIEALKHQIDDMATSNSVIDVPEETTLDQTE